MPLRAPVALISTDNLPFPDGNRETLCFRIGHLFGVDLGLICIHSTVNTWVYHRMEIHELEKVSIYTVVYCSQNWDGVALFFSATAAGFNAAKAT